MVEETKANKRKKPSGQAGETKDINPEQPDQIVTRYMWWSLGTGLIPGRIAGMGALMAVQLKMLKQLSLHYGVDFSENRGKSIVAALLGAISADSFEYGILTKFIKSIPLVRLLSPFTMPVYSGTITHAVGKVFIQHFESGGTFLDLDTQKLKDFFTNFLIEGKKLAYDIKCKDE